MIEFNKDKTKEKDLELAKRIFEQYKKVNKVILDTCVNPFFDKYDVLEEFSSITDVVVIDIMNKFGYDKYDDRMFEIVLFAIDDNKSWDYLLGKVEAYEREVSDCVDDNIYCECGCGRIVGSQKEFNEFITNIKNNVYKIGEPYGN